MPEILPTILRRKRLDAKRRYRDTARIHRASIITVRRRLARIMAAALRMYRGGTDPVNMVVKSLWELREPLEQVMVAAHIVALRRAKLQMRRPPLKLSAVSEALHFFQRKTTLTDSQLRILKDTCASQAVAPLSAFTANAERRLNKAMLDITQQNLHVSKGAAELSKAFENAGISPRSSFQAEAVFRTQTQLAYSEEHWNSNDDPFIQDQLWGYIYMTVGDDRVRDEHAALEETTAAKDDPVWDSIWPPNGWACRCIPVEVWNDEVDLKNPPIKMPPELKQVNEKLVIPGPDAGWDFHPGKLGPRWQGGTPVKMKPAIKPTPSTVPELTERPHHTGSTQRKWEKGITVSEKEAVVWWESDVRAVEAVRSLYKIEAGLAEMPANKMLGLRGDTVATVRQARDKLIGIMDRSPKFEGRAYRGLQVSNPEAVFKQGGIITDTSLASSSIRQEIAEQFFATGATGTKQAVVLHLRVKAGMDISRVGQYYSQREVIIPPKTKFKIWKIQRRGEFLEVHANEIVEEAKTIPKIKAPKLPILKPKPVKPLPTASHTEWTVTTDMSAAGKGVKARTGATDVFVDNYVTKSDEIKHLNQIGLSLSELRRGFPKVAAALDKGYTHEINLVYKPTIPGVTKTGKKIEAFGIYHHSQKKLSLATKGRPLVSKGPKVGYWSAGRAVTDTMRHEIGHALERVLPVKSSGWKLIWARESPQFWNINVSNVACRSAQELWAECFNAYTHPMYGKVGKRLPQFVEDFMEKIIGRHPNLGVGGI